MSSTTSQSSSTFHSLFNNKKTSAETKTKLDLYLSIWDDDQILRLDEKNIFPTNNKFTKAVRYIHDKIFRKSALIGGLKKGDLAQVYVYTVMQD